jgi:hypothetical protein
LPKRNFEGCVLLCLFGIFLDFFDGFSLGFSSYQVRWVCSSILFGLSGVVLLVSDVFMLQDSQHEITMLTFAYLGFIVTMVLAIAYSF